MTVAQQTPPTQVPPAPAGLPPRNGRWSGFRHLLMARLLELKREPEVVFWVFGFPFAARPGAGHRLPQQAGRCYPGCDCCWSRRRRGPEPAAAFTEEFFDPRRRGAGTGGAAGIPPGQIRSGGRTRRQPNGFQYRYDPARPESVLSRAEVDDALQTAAGRKNPVPTSAVTSSEPGSRYIDFLIPGLLGMNLMNSGMWGIGFALVDMRQRKLLKRFVGTPMRRSDFLLALTSSRLVLMVIEIALLLGFGVLVFHMRVLGSLLTILLMATIGAAVLRGAGAAHRQPRAENRKRQRADEPGHDADVDFFRRLSFPTNAFPASFSPLSNCCP